MQEPHEPLSSADGQVASRLGRYLLEEPVGLGRSAIVYRARDTECERLVALKVFRTCASAQLAKQRQAVDRESRVMARVAHPNILGVYGAGEDDGQLYIAMEWVEGQTLREWLSTPRSQVDVLAVFAAAGEGLAAAHQAGVIHADFKPENGLIGVDGRVRLIDFGLARWVDWQEEAPGAAGGSPPEATSASAPVGTPAYMAPEQFGGATATAASDQFSFCVALYEALTGERPFAGTTGAELRENVTRGIWRVSRSSCAIPVNIAKAIRRGLAVSPLMRHPSMSSLIKGMHAELRHPSMPISLNEIHAELPPERGSPSALARGLGWLAAGMFFSIVVWTLASNDQRQQPAVDAAPERNTAPDRILAFHSRLELRTDGRLQVDETIVARGPGQHMLSGFVRPSDSENHLVVQFGQIDGALLIPMSFVKDEVDFIPLRGPANLPSAGEHTLVLHYRLKAPIRHKAGYDELRWSVTGALSLAIDTVTFEFAAPVAGCLRDAASETGLAGCADGQGAVDLAHVQMAGMGPGPVDVVVTWVPTAAFRGIVDRAVEGGPFRDETAGWISDWDDHRQ